MTSPTRVVAKLAEPAIAVDPTSSQQSEQLPTYNAYSADGDVTGRLVYVNYGRPEDYDVLDRLGISVKGAVVIARYGGSWRGIKPKVAAEKGAIGCLIYSDPRDDGYAAELVYPDGPMRNRDGVQRGSVMDMPVHPGDPLTPGIGATKDATRLAVKDAPTIMKIPVLPISYGDAQPLLAAIARAGRAAGVARRAADHLPHRTRRRRRVRLKVAFNWTITPLYNVIARHAGSDLPGRVDRARQPPRRLGERRRGPDRAAWWRSWRRRARSASCVKRGWTPKRTIVYIAWDGEEQALLGSTEWVEAPRRRAAARRWCTSTPTRTAAAYSTRADRTRSKAS